MTYRDIYKIVSFEKIKLITKNNLIIVMSSAKQSGAQIYMVWQIWVYAPNIATFPCRWLWLPKDRFNGFNAKFVICNLYLDIVCSIQCWELHNISCFKCWGNNKNADHEFRYKVLIDVWFPSLTFKTQLSLLEKKWYQIVKKINFKFYLTWDMVGLIHELAFWNIIKCNYNFQTNLSLVS
jgi:hypothetical protein